MGGEYAGSTEGGLVECWWYSSIRMHELNMPLNEEEGTLRVLGSEAPGLNWEGRQALARMCDRARIRGGIFCSRCRRVGWEDLGVREDGEDTGMRK